MKQKLLLILMLVSFISVSFAQGTRGDGRAIIVTDVNSLLFSNPSDASEDSGLARTTSSANTNDIDVLRLKQLVTEVQAATYFYGGNVRTFGSEPKSLYTDLASLNQVNGSIALKQHFEIATIRINTASELNSTIDLAAFSNFPNLKYIYIITKLDTTSENIASRITNYDNRFNIIYKLDKGDSNQ